MVLAGLAEPVFPLSNRGNQSPFVLVIRTKIGDPYGLGFALPVSVLARQWQDAVVPVLQDPRWDLDNPLIAAWLARSPDEVLSLLRGALEQAFVAAGWGPP